MILAGVILILAFSVILHEIAHGYMAYLQGDPTAKQFKRLTLNPASHVDLVGTLLLPMILFFIKSPILFGWAKPVPYNPRNFKYYKFGTFTVSLAGPMMNIALACLFAMLFKLFGSSEIQATLFLYGVSINLILAIFNLIPIPPLDGSKAFSVILPSALRNAYLSLERWGFVILVVLLFTGMIQRILLPLYMWALGVLI